MPYELRLTKALRARGWKVKIRLYERLEEPHVTILRGSVGLWRLSLRTLWFLEKGQSWRKIDDDVRAAIVAHWEVLRSEWDAMYPENPIEGSDDE